MDVDNAKFELTCQLADFFPYYSAVKYVGSIPSNKLKDKLRKMRFVKESLLAMNEASDLQTMMAKKCYEKIKLNESEQTTDNQDLIALKCKTENTIYAIEVVKERIEKENELDETY